MLSRPRRATVTLKIRAICLAGLFVFCSARLTVGGNESEKVWCRPELAPARRVEIAQQLQKITGWKSLGFDANGALHLDNSAPVGGSETARKLLADAVSGRRVLLLEDVSDSQDVVFCRVIEGRWKKAEPTDPPAFIIQIDFADFTRITGDRAALEAFNVGWGVLHEIAHVVNDAEDTETEGDAGECERMINLMRRECGLAERAEYHFKFLQGATDSPFMTRLVRMPFERKSPDSDKRRRYWLIWDAALVGGIYEQKQLAVRR